MEVDEEQLDAKSIGSVPTDQAEQPEFDPSTFFCAVGESAADTVSDGGVGFDAASFFAARADTADFNPAAFYESDEPEAAPTAFEPASFFESVAEPETAPAAFEPATFFETEIEPCPAQVPFDPEAFFMVACTTHDRERHDSEESDSEAESEEYLDYRTPSEPGMPSKLTLVRLGVRAHGSP